jgi:hypothetical protein
MANFQKEVKSLKKEFARLVERNNGSCRIRKSKGSVRIDYQIGDKESFYKWHYTLSDTHALRLMKKDLYNLADRLGISREDSKSAIGFVILMDSQLAWDEWTRESNKIFEEIAQKLKSAERLI